MNDSTSDPKKYLMSPDVATVDKRVEEQIPPSDDARLKQEATRLPDFFICGAAKAGTTSLWYYLRQHPEIFMPEEKEPGYFTGLRGQDSAEEYAELFAPASASQRAGEASGAYLTSPESAARIHRVQPDAKIIIVLRNPADRAYSLYKWMTRHGHEYAPTFRDGLRIERESERKTKTLSSITQDTTTTTFISGLGFTATK